MHKYIYMCWERVRGGGARAVPEPLFPSFGRWGGASTFLKGLLGTRDLYHERTEFRRCLVLIGPARVGELKRLSLRDSSFY